jgi:hypothetical protein
MIRRLSMNARFRGRAALLLVTLVPLAAGCAGASAGMTPSATVTTAVLGWESWLHVDWTPPIGGVIDGYVYSKKGSPLINVSLLAQALDASGNVVGQKLEWVPGSVPGLQRTYFRIPNMPAGSQYRVTVWAFETVESPSYL